MALMGQVLGPVNYHFGAFDREYRSTYSILANSVLHKASASLWISERSCCCFCMPFASLRYMSKEKQMLYEVHNIFAENEM